MTTRFTRRYPDVVWAPVRFVPLVGVAAYLAVLGAATPGAPDWALGMASAALTVAGGRLPLGVTLAQSALVVLGTRLLGATAAAPLLFVLAAVALGELAMRRSRRQLVAGTLGYVVAQLLVYGEHPDPVFTPVTLLLATAPPVLLGGYVRSVLRVAVRERLERESAVRAARAGERTAIARELHDLVAHHLASVAMGVGAARLALGGREPQVATALDSVHGTTRTALDDLRRLVATLRDADSVDESGGAALAGPEGLTAALGGVVERTRTAGPSVDAELDPAVGDLDSMRRLAVLRVVQEGLTNVVKHAGPEAHVCVRVAATEGEVTVTIRDRDGDGVTAEQAVTTAAPGFGLVGIRERVELLGGTMRAGARDDGWALEVWLPAANGRVSR